MATVRGLELRQKVRFIKRPSGWWIIPAYDPPHFKPPLDKGKEDEPADG